MDSHRAQMQPTDVLVGLIAGLVATQVTNFAQAPLQRMTPESVKRRERRNHLTETTSRIAARRIYEHFNMSPSQRQLTQMGRLIHFGVGMAWGPVYGALRCYGGLGPLGAGVLTGTTMSLILDEGAVSALGLSATNKGHPLLTHIRGFVAHLVYGAIAALATEKLRLVLRLAPIGSGTA